MSRSIDDETKYLRLMITAHICPSHPGLKGCNIEKLKNDYFQSYGRGVIIILPPNDFTFSRMD